MKTKISSILFLLIFLILFACSNYEPSDARIFQLINTQTIIKRYDSLELLAVTKLSSHKKDDKYIARLKIDFNSKENVDHWDDESKNNIVPFGAKVIIGNNSTEVTVTFIISYAGDGSWQIESISL